MTGEAGEVKDTFAVVRKIVEHHGAVEQELIPILADVNRELGYLPREALEAIGEMLGVPSSRLFSVASFYHMLSTKPQGKHVVKFCESAPCHVVGGREVLEALYEHLGLESGETSEDGRWTLVLTSCLGLCSVGPVVLVDDDAYGNVTPERVPEILAQYE
jgi:NADH-quinone oxidoreductase subunit E